MRERKKEEEKKKKKSFVKFIFYTQYNIKITSTAYKIGKINN